MRDVVKAVTVLTAPTTTVIEGHTVTEPALLTRLLSGIHASVGRTQGGATIPSERNALNLGAFHVFEDISGQIASMLATATEQMPDRDPRINLLRWYDAFELAWHRGTIIDRQVNVAVDRLRSFSSRIDDLFDPAAVGEIKGTCPNCGESRWFTDSRGASTTALFTLRRQGYLEARCHWCDEKWIGTEGLRTLNRDMGDTPNSTEDLHTTP